MAKYTPEKNFRPTSAETQFTPSPYAGCIYIPSEEVFGIFKFRGLMLLGFRAYCFSRNLDMNDSGVQADYLLKQLEENTELRGSELKNAETIEKAAQLIHEYILKDNANIDKTVNLAYDFLERNTA